jgi:hypothetical protein
MIYGVKRIKDGQYQKENKRQGEGNPPNVQNSLFNPSIEPEKEGPQ